MAYRGGRGEMSFSSQLAVILNNNRQNIDHDVSENGFKETFCIGVINFL